MKINNLFLLLCSFSLILISPISDAVTLQQFFTPVSAGGVAITSTKDALISTTYRAVDSLGLPVFAKRTVNIPKSVLTTAIKKRAFNPLSFGVVAAIELAGYLINSDTQSVVTQSTPLDAGSITGTCDVVPYYGPATFQQCVDAAYARAAELEPTVWSKGNVVTQDLWTDRLYFYTTMDDNRTLPLGYFYHTSEDDAIVSATTTLEMESSQPQDVSDDDLYAAVEAAARASNNDLWRDVVTDPALGRIDPDIQEFKDAGLDLDADYEAANDGDPLTNPTTDPATGDTGLDSIGDTPPAETLQEDLCEKHPEILACKVDGDELLPVDIGTLTPDFTNTPITLLSNSTCPSNPQIVTSHGLMGEMDIQPMCNMVIDLKPIVLILFSLTALYILSGAVRS